MQGIMNKTFCSPTDVTSLFLKKKDKIADS